MRPLIAAFTLAAVSATGCTFERNADRPPTEAEYQYDVVIRGGTVYDGLGGPGVRADVAIAGDTIAWIGRFPDDSTTAVLEVDATGLAVAPGFINVLSWANESLLVDGRSLGNVKQGVTLEIFGEGSSMGPWNAAMKQAELESQGHITFDVDWTTLGQYLEHLEARGVAPNVASLVGATTVRVHELGREDRAPTDEELERMRALVAGAMEEGALGLGTSLIYAPAFYASTDELIALAEVAGRYGGIYTSHMRSEGNAILAALDELTTVARDADIPAEIYHLKLAGAENWDDLDAVLEKIDAARAAGLRITTDMYTYTAGATGLDAAMPPWVQEGGYEAWRDRLIDPAIRARVLEEMRTPTDEWESLYLLAGSPERVIVTGFRQDSLKPLIGKSLAEIAALRGTTAEDVAIDLVVENGADVGTVYFLMSEENVRRQIGLPYMSFGSDAASMAAEGVFLEAGTHPRAYGNFARLLGRYVRDEGVIPLAEAVRRLSSLPARNFSLWRRGRLSSGYFADVVVFDPATIIDHATFEQPHQYATGVEHVFVNGEAVLLGGEPTGALPGRVVRGPGWTGWENADLADEERLERLVAHAASRLPAEVGIAVIDLETGAAASSDGNLVMHAASTMKVPVMLELFRQVAAGERSLDQPIPVRNSFTSIADSSRYALTPVEDSETDLYRRVGTTATLEDLTRRMIVRSSNLATNLLIEEADAGRVRALMAAIGASGMNVLRGVEDIPAYEAGLSNTTTARALARVLEVIARCAEGDVVAALRPLESAACETMIDILAEQEFTEGIPSGVPDGIRVANKTGWITRITHDAAIVYPPDRDPYVLVVLVRGLEDHAVASEAIADISARVWAHVTAPG